MEKQKKLSVEEASYILDCSDTAVRKGMVQGNLPIGFFVDNGKGRKKSFYIYESMLKKYLGLN